jgi:hypothetical protein
MSAESLFTAEEVEVGSRYPIPEGWCTPTELTHILRARGIIKHLAPQQIYTGFIRRTNSDFPFKRLPPDDNRYIVPIEASIQWIVTWLQNKAEKEAEKAAQAAKRAQTAIKAAGMTMQPVASSVEDSIEIESSNELGIESQDEWGDSWANE